MQAVFVAVKNKMDLSIAVALGSSIQIAVFLIPVVVLVGWALGHDFTLVSTPARQAAVGWHALAACMVWKRALAPGALLDFPPGLAIAGSGRKMGGRAAGWAVSNTAQPSLFAPTFAATRAGL